MNSLPDAVTKSAFGHAAVTRVSAAKTFVRSSGLWTTILVIVFVLGYVYYDSLAYMADQWINNENYSHGLLVPFISLYLIMQKLEVLRTQDWSGSWWGILLVVGGMALYITGEVGTVYLLLNISLWCILVGLLWSALGTRLISTIAFPLGILLTAIPLPQFLHQGLSGQFQLWSSALGVGFLHIAGVTAFREGNVIDLGPMQLQVVDACSGLRYLFPLTIVALVCSYLFESRLWKRIVLVASSIPISILLNGFRIAMIGLLIEYFGKGAAVGFFHFFEGWVFFMASVGLLLSEMWILRRIDTSGETISQANGVGTARTPLAAAGRPISPRATPLPTFSRSSYLCSVGVILLMPLVSTQIVIRDEIIPPRQLFLDFPMSLEGWTGRFIPLEPQYIEVLQFDDYLLADYRRSDSSPVNLYVAYYGSQRKGQSAHSPQSCMPGGGWEMASINSVRLDPGGDHTSPFVNRAVIQKGDQRRLVLYWFKQRSRIVASEYLVKAYMVWDAMTRGRTDGALVRLTTAVGPNETNASAEERVMNFARIVHPALTPYVPD